MPRPRKPASPFRYFKQLARGDPASGADVREEPAAVAKGIVMSGRHLAIKGEFGRPTVADAVMSPAFDRGFIHWP